MRQRSEAGVYEKTEISGRVCRGRIFGNRDADWAMGAGEFRGARRVPNQGWELHWSPSTTLRAGFRCAQDDKRVGPALAVSSSGHFSRRVPSDYVVSMKFWRLGKWIGE